MAKYCAPASFKLTDRTWPDKTIQNPPIWCSVDLRDGNQALPVPMSIAQKLKFFQLLVKIGFKEIEVGFPSSSKTEFNFLRTLIEQDLIPDDVTIQVLCQCKENLIKQTFQALKGAKKAIFHIYCATSEVHRKYNFGLSKEETKNLAIQGVKMVKQNLSLAAETQITLEYSPEDFSNTEIDYALEVCNAVQNEWCTSENKKLILNLPSTVENLMPNEFADRIEYFCRKINNRENVVISLHDHNDRGCAVSECEMALLAGADRVEGTLFGNGERTGNLDIMTVAMNMFANGLNTGLDFSNLEKIKEQYTSMTQMSVPDRHPYAGDYVFTSFSGSHQDAIRKVLAHRKDLSEKWCVPYLLIDPQDVGRNYEEIIRINSQSGKGGAAWILETEFGLYLPKGMQAEFGKVVKERSDFLQRELSYVELYELFFDKWFSKQKKLQILDFAETHIDGSDTSNNVLCRATISFNDKTYAIGAKGNGPLSAFIAALKNESLVNADVTINSYSEHSVGTGSETDAVAYIELKLSNGNLVWGAGKSPNVSRAGVDAIVSALNQAL